MDEAHHLGEEAGPGLRVTLMPVAAVAIRIRVRMGIARQPVATDIRIGGQIAVHPRQAVPVKVRLSIDVRVRPAMHRRIAPSRLQQADATSSQ
jgi:hypothetical protein